MDAATRRRISDAGHEYAACYSCDARRMGIHGRMCADCRREAEAAEKRAVQIADPDSDEAPEERPFEIRLAEGFELLNGWEDRSAGTDGGGRSCGSQPGVDFMTHRRKESE